MLHSSATPGSSYGSLPPPPPKQLPHIGTMVKQTAAAQVQRPSAAEAIIKTIAAAVDDTSATKSPSRTVLGLFSRSKSDSKPDSGARRASTSTALRSNADRSKRTNQWVNGPTQNGQDKSISFAKATAKAFKQITLAVPTMDADSLLRLAYARQEAQRTTLDDADSTDSRRRILEDAPMYWTTSAFVLTKDAVLYQYPATGSSRRLPDRFIQLTSDSAAFASDVLPGKHWVLRITQAFRQSPTTPVAKSRFSKLGIRPTKDETLNNILLVMESAEEMNAWQAAVKDVIASQTPQVREIYRKPVATTASSTFELPVQYTPRTSLQKDAQSLRRAVSAMQLSNAPSRAPSIGKRHVSAAASTAGMPAELPGNEPKSTTVKTATEDLSRMLSQLGGDDSSSSESSPAQDGSDQNAPQWDLPANIRHGLSLASPTVIAFPKSHQRNSSDDLSAQNRLSTSMASVGTRQSSVPSLSYRFSQSTRAGTIIDTPSQSARSSMCGPSTSQATKDLLLRRGAAALPLILTDSGARGLRDNHGVESDLNYQGVSEVEEDIVSPIDISPRIPKRYSSLNVIRSEDWEDVGDSKDTYPPMLSPRKRLSSLIPDDSALILSPRKLSIMNPGSPRIVSTAKKLSLANSQTSSPLVSSFAAELPGCPVLTTKPTSFSLVDAKVIAEEPIPTFEARLETLPRAGAKSSTYPSSAPPTQLSFKIGSSPTSPVLSKFNTSFRLCSSQGSSSINQLRSKPSAVSLLQTSTSKAVTIRERRSIPSHLRGPPAPPPTRSLPAVPTANPTVLSC